MDLLKPIPQLLVLFLWLSLLPSLVVEARLEVRDEDTVEENQSYILSTQSQHHEAVREAANDFEDAENQWRLRSVKRNLPGLPGTFFPKEDLQRTVPASASAWINSKDYPPGISIDKSTCDSSAQVAIRDAVIFTQEYAVAALQATKDTYNGLFPFFFFRKDVKLVNAVMKRINSSTYGIGPAIHITCKDDFEICGRPELPFAYGVDPPGSVAHIVVCPFFLSQPTAADSCDEGKLHASVPDKAKSLIHELSHLRSITATPQKTIIQDLVPYGWPNAHWLTTRENTQKLRPSRNADNYAYFAQWAWIEAQQRMKCPEAYPLWGFTSSTKNELRKLLLNHGSTDQISGESKCRGFCEGPGNCEPGCKCQVQADRHWNTHIENFGLCTAGG